MKFFGSLRSCTRPSVLVAVAAVFVVVISTAHAVLPFNSATVTRVENKVNYGQVKGGRSQTRPASPQDVVTASDFLLSETASRAELKYPDGTIVRVGQNTVFSFDANTRTLSLDKGTFIFFVPKGAGGCTIKTPSYTAAITGCEGAVTTTALFLKEGLASIGGKTITGGQFYKNGQTGNGTVTGGKLDSFGGPIGGGELGGNPLSPSGFPEDLTGTGGPGNPYNQPGSVIKNNPPPADKPNVKVKVPKSDTSAPPPPPNS